MEKSKILIERRTEGMVQIEKDNNTVVEPFILSMDINILKNVISKLNPECTVEIV